MESGSKGSGKRVPDVQGHWPITIPAANFNMHVSNYGLQVTWDRARDIINASRELANYLELVESEGNSLGFLVCRAQLCRQYPVGLQ